MQRPIYLDHHATTPLAPQVLTAMMPYWTDAFGNPASLGHFYGWEAQAAVQQARETIAAAINAQPDEIVFTSGATEANNLAIKGVAEAYLQRGRHLITVMTEHRAVLEPCAYLETLGFKVTYLPVQADGRLELTQLSTAIRADTILVSVMAANNEIGVLQPLAEIGYICRSHQVLFHTDAAQALGKIPLDVEALSVDLMSLTAHKLYGPKGIGALYVRRRQPRVQLAPQLHGGGQEQGRRAGTLYTPQVVGFSVAVQLSLERLESETVQLQQLRDRLWQQLQTLSGVVLNGHPHHRLAGNLNITIADVDGAALLLVLQPTVALSSGSACSQHQPSHVLLALGHSAEQAKASLRFGLGRSNTITQVDHVAQVLIEAVRSLRQNSVYS
ncbi:MAG: cysteine desulfurase [Spirulina sp. SIO3F2]|nr:cysteine desulfurase [Spirulina sp. SIO3F2]